VALYGRNFETADSNSAQRTEVESFVAGSQYTYNHNFYNEKYVGKLSSRKIGLERHVARIEEDRNTFKV
jgi:hypothetical protein